MTFLAVDHDAILAADRGLWRALNGFEGWRVVLIVPKEWREGEKAITAELEDTGLNVIPLRALFKGKTHRAVYPGLAKVVKEVAPDVLFVNGEPESFLAAQVAWIKRHSRRPMRMAFASWRNIDYTRIGFPYVLPIFNNLSQRMAFRDADICVARNTSAREILRALGFPRAVVIPPFVDTGVFHASQRVGLRPDTGSTRSLVIGYVGRLAPEKGVDLLLHAFVSLPDEFSLVIVGGGPAKPELMRLARALGIIGRTRWVQPVSHPQVASQMASLDILVLPSRTTRTWREQFGRVLIEAMACGVAVIGSDSGEIPSVIGDAGLVFKEGDVPDLRRRLITLSDPETRERLIQNGLHRVDTTYRKEAVVPLWRDAFAS